MHNVKLIPVSEINTVARLHVGVREAAELLGVSERSIRRAAKRAGVRRIAGHTVRGGILIERHPNPILITYSA